MGMGTKEAILLLCAIILSLTQLCVSTQSLTLDLGTSNKAAYNNLINQLRLLVKAKTEYDGIPMMNPPPKPPGYIIIKLLAKKGAMDISLSVAINNTNLFVVGYADESMRKAFFFSDSQGAEPSIFPGQLVKEVLHFKSTYGDILEKSGLKRENLIFTLERFRFHMLAVHGQVGTKSSFTGDQAKFLLYAIQAFSEGARFKYVQKKFNTRPPYPPEPDYKVPELENDWQTISKEVKYAVKRKFKNPVILVNEKGSRWVVTTVDEIKPDMGILLYVP